MKPSENPAFTQRKRIGTDRPLFSKAILINYMDAFDNLIRTVESKKQKIDIEEIISAFSKVSPATTRKHLKSYLDVCQDDLLHITGFYPDKDTLIAMAEKKIGPVSGKNLVEANLICKGMVEEISKPRHKRFIEGQLSNMITNETVTIGLCPLVDMLFEEYVSFIRESDNGLVSIAGSLNEAIFIRGLINEGLIEGRDVIKTGTDSDGDLKIQHNGRRGVEVLYVEIKSYAARERLLRGLQDIKSQNKIGVGFFNNPAEFNPKRTNTLLAADPLAIYMPRGTWGHVSAESREKVTRQGDFLYRPLDMFVADMKCFVEEGHLRPFRK